MSRFPSSINQFTNLWDTVNANETDCRWTTSVHNAKVGKYKACDFPLEKLILCDYNGRKLDIRRLPAGTTLATFVFDKTQLFRGSQKAWYRSQYPVSADNGGTWFGTLNMFNMVPSKNTKLVYRTIKDIDLIFIQNMKKTYNEKGYGFIQRHFGAMQKQVYESCTYSDGASVELFGYAGCNECEIFIENAVLTSDFFEALTETHPVVAATNAFID